MPVRSGSLLATLCLRLAAALCQQTCKRDAAPSLFVAELALRSIAITPASKTDCATFEMALDTVGLCRAAGRARRALLAAFFASNART
jgi:hypothetical protein